MSVNKVILLGRVGADPEVKYMPSGNAVVNLSIATNRKFKNQESGNYEDKTEWHRVVFFNKPAETIGQYVKKGQQLYVEGRLQTRKWQDKDGNDRYTTEVILQGYNCNLTLLDSRNSNSQVSDNSQEMDQSKSIEDNSFGNQSSDSDDLDEDIPF